MWLGGIEVTEPLKILAVDLSSVCRSAWSMFTNARVTEGDAFRIAVEKVTRASDGFDRVALCYDWGRTGRSFRRLACPTYKAGRESPGEPYYAMLRDVGKRLVSDGAVAFPRAEENVWRPEWVERSEDGREVKLFAEADDVIASLTAWYLRQKQGPDDGWQLRILSGDTDTWALVDDEQNIDVVTLDGEIVTLDAVVKRYGVSPHLVREVKALGGDDGDGYKPFPHHEPPSDPEGKRKPGIGLKKAAELIAKWGQFATDVRPAASVMSAAIAGSNDTSGDYGMPDGHERKCLLAASFAGLNMGYACATMLSDLPIDFTPVLAEPVVKPIHEPTAPAPSKASAPIERERPAALVLTSGQGFDPLALQPNGLDDMRELATILVNGRMFPQLGGIDAIASVIFEARERGIPAATALRNAYMVKGRPAWSAAMIAGMVKASPVCALFRIKETTATYATVEYRRADEPDGPFLFKFTIEEARAAGWLRSSDKGDSKWITNPRTMLRWAALREAARAFFPDVVSGVYTREELAGEVSNEELRREEEMLGEVMK